MRQINNPLVNSNTNTIDLTTDITGTGGDFNFGEILSNPTLDTGMQKYTNPINPTPKPETTSFDFGDFFSAENLGGTMQGIGAIGGAIANIYGTVEQKKFNDDMLDMEKDRVAKENHLRDQQQAEYDKVWKS